MKETIELETNDAGSLKSIKGKCKGIDGFKQQIEKIRMCLE